MSGRPLRILYVGTLPPHRGGSAIMASQLLAGLSASGHEIEAISPITAQALDRGDAFAARDAAFSILRFTMPNLNASPDTPPPRDYAQREGAEIKRLFERSIAKRHADVVIIGRESFAPHAVDLARDIGIPTVLVFQGSTTRGILNGTYPRQPARHLIEHFRNVDVPVACAEHMRGAITRLGVSNVRVIPHPVDVQRFRPLAPSSAARRSLGIGDSDLVVTHLSNLKPVKRAGDFVEAAALATPKERRLLLVVVGDGPCRWELEQMCATRGISDRFRFTGWVDHGRIPEIISCSDIVCHPSAGEGLALVYLETQACQRTLVASDIPAAREVIEHGRTGLLHRTGDASDLASKLLMAARDEELRARIGHQAREAAGTHSLQRVVSRYDELLNAVVGKTGTQDATSR